jgi:hypothetical protein
VGKRPWGVAPPPYSLFEKSEAKTFISRKATLFGGDFAPILVFYKKLITYPQILQQTKPNHCRS